MSAGPVGGYTLHETVGSGSTATVYRATRGAEVVAIKVLHPHLSQDPVIRTRFLREVTLARRLAHPSIVRVFDLVTPDDPEEPPCAVMEYCPGGNLVGWRAPGPEEIVALATQVAGALEAAHGAGLIHRDLKPSNILRDERGGYRVCDFGSAGVQDSVSLSTSSLFLDAPFYVAPEVFEGHPADPRSDLYSLGALLYAASTGGQARDHVLPSVQREAGTERRHLQEKLPPWLADLVLRLLEPLETRPPDAATVLRALSRGGAPAPAAMKRCLFCGAHLPRGAPLCLSCGQEEIGIAPPAMGEEHCVTLRSVREDAATLERMTGVLRALSGDASYELELMFGDPRYYSSEERKRKRKLPVRIVEGLSAGDAERLRSLLMTFKVRATVHPMRKVKTLKKGPLVRLRPGAVAGSVGLDTLRQGATRLPGLQDPWMRDLVARLIFAVYGLEEAGRRHELGALLQPITRSLNGLAQRLAEDLSTLGKGGVSRAALAAEVAKAAWAEEEAAGKPDTTGRAMDPSERRRAALGALEKLDETEHRRADVMARILRLCGTLEGVSRDLTPGDPEGEVRAALAELEAELSGPASAQRQGPDRG